MIKPYDPAWSVKKAILNQVEREDLLNWSKRPPNTQKPQYPTVPLKTSLIGSYALMQGIYKEGRRWIP